MSAFETVVVPFLNAAHDVLRTTGSTITVEIAVNGRLFDQLAAELGIEVEAGERMVIAGVGIRRLGD